MSVGIEKDMIASITPEKRLLTDTIKIIIESPV